MLFPMDVVYSRCVCVRACVRACVCARTCVCVCVCMCRAAYGIRGLGQIELPKISGGGGQIELSKILGGGGGGEGGGNTIWECIGSCGGEGYYR